MVKVKISVSHDTSTAPRVKPYLSIREHVLHRPQTVVLADFITKAQLGQNKYTAHSRTKPDAISPLNRFDENGAGGKKWKGEGGEKKGLSERQYFTKKS